jgi:hypothetical protein
VPYYKNGQQGTPESHERNGGNTDRFSNRHHEIHERRHKSQPRKNGHHATKDGRRLRRNETRNKNWPRTPEREMKAQMASLGSWMDAQHERMMACLGRMEATGLKTNPEEMQSEVEHREVPKE